MGDTPLRASVRIALQRNKNYSETTDDSDSSAEENIDTPPSSKLRKEELVVPKMAQIPDNFKFEDLAQNNLIGFNSFMEEHFKKFMEANMNTAIKTAMDEYMKTVYAEWERRFLHGVEEIITRKVNNQLNGVNEEIKNMNEKIGELETRVTSLTSNSDLLSSRNDTNTSEQARLNKELDDKLAKIQKTEKKLKKTEAEQASQSVIISSTKNESKIPHFTERENLIEKTAELLRNSSKYHVQSSNIVSARRMGAKPKQGDPDQRKIVVKFVDKEIKKEILQAHITNRLTSGKGIYINEVLLNDVNSLHYWLRKAKKDNPEKIKSIHTTSGIIKVKLKQFQNTMEVIDHDDYLKVLDTLLITDIYSQPPVQEGASQSI